MTATIAHPEFCEGIQYFGAPWPEFQQQAAAAAIPAGKAAIADPRAADAAYQTLLMADALRYVTLQMCGAKGSGHPGGFASSAEAYAALVMLGHTNIVTEVGHHAPGFYSAMFLDTSLEAMGIRTMTDMMARSREKHGLLGPLSGAIPGLLAPAGPLGQGVATSVGMALGERLRALAAVITPTRVLRLSEAFTGNGDDLLAAARENGLEGIVAKRATSRYESRRSREARTLLRQARALLLRDDGPLDGEARARLQQALAQSEALALVVRFRERLKAIWQNAATGPDKAVAALEQWCCEAETSGVAALEQFARRLGGWRPATG